MRECEKRRSSKKANLNSCSRNKRVKEVGDEKKEEAVSAVKVTQVSFDCLPIVRASNRKNSPR